MRDGDGNKKCFVRLYKKTLFAAKKNMRNKTEYIL